MSSYIDSVNQAPLYAYVAVVLGFVAVCCVLFILKSYKEGIRIGMDKAILKKTITSSALFTVLPSLSILLGVIALSGSLGVPTAWLRLSVVGNLSYEAIAAEAAAQGMGVTLDTSVMTADHLVTIIAVMTAGICFGCLMSLFFLKRYSEKCTSKLNTENTGKGGFANWAMSAMFIGMCSTFIGSYTADLFLDFNYIPLFTAAVSFIIMFVLDYLSKKKNIKMLDNFSLALSMLLAMAASVLISL